jgi:membrane glycosyltransferase
MAAVNSLDLEAFAAQTLWRRALMFGPVALLTAVGIWMMAVALAGNGLTDAELGLLGLFAITFGWIVLSSWAGVVGFVLMLLGRHPITLRPITPPQPERALSARIAVLMPIHNEDPRRVLAGLIATYRSVHQLPSGDLFDFFVLSDTRDPAIAQDEESLIAHATILLGHRPRICYRRRTLNTGRKAGNIADWVREHGPAYECMVVLDADSVMAGTTLVHLAALMEANPQTGIIQTLTFPTSRETFFARALQFASRLYGPVIATGQSFWQLGDANYFGHNAIIRIRPFLQHCMLPRIPGAPPLGGEVLSHDFVEAAFMRRAGWFVWMLPELPGSFEEMPSNLIDYAARDRRWIQGNLQHLRLLGPAGRWVGRAHLLMGAVAFLAAPLWLLLLLATSGVVIHEAVVGHAFFPSERVLFPIWPDYRTTMVYALLALTIAVLLAPRLLSVILVAIDGARRRAFGGLGRLAASALVELVFSTLLAPVLMLLHTRFVAMILMGGSVDWMAQPRDDQAVSWRTALARHGPHMAAGLLWAALIYAFAPDFLPWILPIAVGLALSAPLNVLSSSVTVGLWARQAGLLVTPEELSPPSELEATRRIGAAPPASQLPA